MEHIIEPLIKYDISRLFLGDARKGIVLHQDSASDHVAIGLLIWESLVFKFITLDYRLPKSKDTASISCLIWRIMK